MRFDLFYELAMPTGSGRSETAAYANAEAGVTHLLCAFGAGALDSGSVRESMELFAREVMPAFAPDSGSGIGH